MLSHQALLLSVASSGDRDSDRLDVAERLFVSVGDEVGLTSSVIRLSLLGMNAVTAARTA